MVVVLGREYDFIERDVGHSVFSTVVFLCFRAGLFGRSFIGHDVLSESLDLTFHIIVVGKGFFLLTSCGDTEGGIGGIDSGLRIFKGLVGEGCSEVVDSSIG